LTFISSALIRDFFRAGRDNNSLASMWVYSLRRRSGTCPTFHPAKNFRRWDLLDPAAVEGTVQKQLEAFCSIRDEIRHNVWELISDRYLDIQDKAAVKA
jgi:hypothetical protein